MQLPTAIYVYPGAEWSPDGGSRSKIADTEQHLAFERDRKTLLGCSIRTVGLSSLPAEELNTSVFAALIGHVLWSDPQLQLADTLGLPTYAYAGTRWYRRITLIAAKGQILAALPVSSPNRAAQQVISWMTSNASSGIAA